MKTDSLGRKIYAVIVPVPKAIQIAKGRSKVAALSREARRALAISAREGGLSLPDPPSKDEDGVPRPVGGIHWSVTHKSAYAGGVAAPSRVGIDIEKIRPCSEALFRRVADQGEWDLWDTDPTLLFFRYWTAKESVLKAAGIGMTGLSRCRIMDVVDEAHLIVAYGGRQWLIEQYSFDGHIAAVTQKDYRICWRLVDE
jgi:4'-phosphopantetheinyl transferase